MRRFPAFLPFVGLGLLHLLGLFAQFEALAWITKAMLMPALLIPALVYLRGARSLPFVVGAILASWVGDIWLSSPGQGGFVVGLAAFLLAHVIYLALFVRVLRRRTFVLWGLVLVGWWLALLIVLAGHIGGLVVPVAAYGAVLAASTAASFSTSRSVVWGAVLFLVSDTVLAFKLFWPMFSLWQADFLIMLGYISGQGLIILGVVLQHRRGWELPRPTRALPSADAGSMRFCSWVRGRDRP